MSRALRYLLAALAGAFLATAVAVAVAGESDQVQPTTLDGLTVESLRPTGVGLPRVGADGTTGAGDYATPLKTYHDSGAYQADLKSVAAEAKQFLQKRLKKRSQKAKKCKKPGSKTDCPKGKPGLVLDIDETSLSNYEEIAAANFTGTVGALAAAAVSGDSPAIGPTRKLFNWATEHKVAVFFITGRPAAVPVIVTATEQNLRDEGYSGWKELHFKDTGETTKEYKSSTRAEIEQEGYKILVNMGDQDSDLSGGHAVRGFKLPNPYYFIGDE